MYQREPRPFFKGPLEIIPSLSYPMTLKKHTWLDPPVWTSTQCLHWQRQMLKGRSLAVGSTSSKQLSVKPEQSWGIPGSIMSQMEHLDSILPRFLSRYIQLPAEKEAGKKVHKLLPNKSSKFS